MEASTLGTTTNISVAVRVRDIPEGERKDSPWLIDGKVITLAKSGMEQAFAFGRGALH